MKVSYDSKRSLCEHKWLCEKMMSRRDGDLQYTKTKYVCDKCDEEDVRIEMRNINNGKCYNFVEWK